MRKLTKSPIAWGIIATLAYFLGFFLFLAIAGKYPWKQLDLNEAGDFSAGIFAPLAFVWLVVAVFLQKQELGAQREQLNQQMEELKLSREELKLNREELQLNRQLLQEQSEELRKQSNDISFQRVVLDESTSIRRLETECESFIRKLVTELQKFGWSQGTLQQSAFSYQRNIIPEMLAADQFAEAARATQNPIKQIINAKRFGYTSLGDVNISKIILEKLIHRIGETENISRSFEAYELDKLLSMIDELLEKAKLTEK